MQAFDEAIRQYQRQKVGIREIPVIMRLFLRAHRAGFPVARIVEPRFLVDLATILENGDLAPRLDLDGLADEADRIDVLDLAARAQRRTRTPDRDIDVRAEIALLHIAIAGAEIAQDLAQLGHIGLRLLGRAKVRLRDDFHQRDTGAVQINKGIVRILIMDRLAGILLQVQPLDPDHDRLGLPRHIDDNLALTHDRFGELADLVALGQIGIEIVLPIETRLAVDLRLQAQPGPNRLRDAFAIDDGEHARHGRIDKAHMRVRLAAKSGRGPGKKLGLRIDLRVDLHTDDDFPIGFGTLDPVFRRGGTDIERHDLAFMSEGRFGFREGRGHRQALTSAAGQGTAQCAGGKAGQKEHAGAEQGLPPADRQVGIEDCPDREHHEKRGYGEAQDAHRDEDSQHDGGGDRHFRAPASFSDAQRLREYRPRCRHTKAGRSGGPRCGRNPARA